MAGPVPDGVFTCAGARTGGDAELPEDELDAGGPDFLGQALQVSCGTTDNLNPVRQAHFTP